MLTYALRDGGPMMWPILLLTVLAWGVGLPIGLIRLARLRVPLAATLVLPVAVPVTGALGSLLGVAQAMSAMEHASAEMKQTLFGDLVLHALEHRGIVLPALASEHPAPYVAEVSVSAQEVRVGWSRSVPVYDGRFHEDDVEDGVVASLAEAFAEDVERSRALELVHPGAPFRPEIMAQADQNLGWGTVRGVLYPASLSGYQTVHVAGVADETLVVVTVGVVLIRDDRLVKLILEEAPRDTDEPEAEPPPSWSVHVMPAGVTVEGKPAADLPAAVAALDRDRRLLVSADAGVPWGDLATVLCALACGNGDREVALSVE